MNRLHAFTLALLATTAVWDRPAFASPDEAPPDSDEHEVKAEPPSMTPEAAEAHRRFLRGVELYREQSYDAAVAEFSKAYQLVPDHRVLYNLAQVQAERHDYVAALKLFKEYLEHGDEGIPAKRLEEVRETMADLQGRVAVLWVQSPARSAELLVDGVVAGILPMTEPLLVNAGVHQLQLRRQGAPTITRVLTIAGGDTLRLRLQEAFDRPGAAAPVTALPAGADFEVQRGVSDDSESLGVPVWISLAVGGVLAGSALAFGALANSSSEALDRELDRVPADGDRVADARGDLKRYAVLSDASTAGALVALGLSLYFALARGDTSPRERASTRLVPRIGVATQGVDFVRAF